MAESRLIETNFFASMLREKVIRPSTRQVLVSRISGSDQEQDLTLPPNCRGLGRVHHFRRTRGNDWLPNPLPIDPAARALGLPSQDMMKAQLFQNAACAWRCWYCYVPFDLLAAHPARAEWITADELVRLYTEEINPPPILDLSGGSPDLTPEWVVWTMEALINRGLAESTYLWSDDNLSTDYLYTQLDKGARELITSYRNYGRVCCFKGFDAASFSFNTNAESAGYERQFEIFRRYLELDIDLYGYVTLTGPDLSAVSNGVRGFVNRLRDIHDALPLRVVPLRVEQFGPTRGRDERRPRRRLALGLAVQEAAIECWIRELERHYSTAELTLPIVDVPLRRSL